MNIETHTLEMRVWFQLLMNFSFWILLDPFYLNKYNLEKKLFRGSAATSQTLLSNGEVSN